MENNHSLLVIMESAKAETIAAFNMIQEKYKLPAYLLEPILTDLLVQVKTQKNLELLNDIQTSTKQKEGED